MTEERIYKLAYFELLRRLDEETKKPAKNRITQIRIAALNDEIKFLCSEILKMEQE